MHRSAHWARPGLCSRMACTSGIWGGRSWASRDRKRTRLPRAGGIATKGFPHICSECCRRFRYPVKNGEARFHSGQPDPRRGRSRGCQDTRRHLVLPDCPPPLFGLAHSMGATVLIRAAARGNRWFERMVLCAPMIKLTNVPLLALAPTFARTMRMAGLGAAFIPGGGPACSASAPFLDNPVTSDPIRHARTAAIIEAEPALALGAPTIAWADAALRTMADFANPAFPATLRQPMLIVACGRDRLVST